MAVTYLSSISKGNSEAKSGPAPINMKWYNQPTSSAATNVSSDLNVTKSSEKKNKGGLFGGAGYVLESLGLGLLSGLEGFVDFAGAGLAKLFGQDDWAESIIDNDWVNYNHANEWFNPGKGWELAGNVASGIGTSLPGVASAVGLTLATGGTALPAAAKIATVGIGSGLTSGISAAGRATSEAYDQTGQLGKEEFLYGMTSGALEGGLEGLTNVIGLGTGAVVKSFSRAFGKEVGESVAKETVLKTLGKSFAGEAFEEATAEYLDPYIKRATYDQGAQNASADQVLYAGLVGGLSGVAMGGGGHILKTGATAINNRSKGETIYKSNKMDQVLNNSVEIEEIAKNSGYTEGIFGDIISTKKALSESLKNTNGEIKTSQQQRMLGALYEANAKGALLLHLANRATGIVKNAASISERLNSYGYKGEDGKPLNFSVRQLTKGYDASNPSSIFKALETNEELRSLAIADAAGNMIINTKKFVKSIEAGERLANQIDFKKFLETATPKEIKAVSDALGIEQWQQTTKKSIANSIAEYIMDGGADANVQKKELINQFKNVKASYNIPKIFAYNNDGIRRFSDGNADIGVYKKGDEYAVFNYADNTLTKNISRSEVNSIFKSYSDARANEFSNAFAKENEATAPQASKIIANVNADDGEIDNYASKNIKSYKGLNDSNKVKIRNLIREGRSNGISDSDVLTYAKVSARSGIEIVFDKEANKVIDEDGNVSYADGHYDWRNNLIAVNPESKRGVERLLIHELDHAVRGYFKEDGSRMTAVFEKAYNSVPDEVKQKIRERYEKNSYSENFEDVFKDELNAYFAEIMLTNKYTLEMLIDEKPTLKDRILSFFKRASKDYADVPKLSGSAKWYYKKFKKMFDEFAARNAQSNANEKTLTSMNQENMQVSDRQYAIKKDVHGKKYVEVDSEIVNETDSIDAIGEVLSNVVETRFNEFIKADGQQIGINQKTRREWIRSKSAQTLLQDNKQTFLDKMNAFGNADELLQAAKNYIGEKAKHTRKDNFVEFARGVVTFSVKGRGYEADVIVGTTKSGAAVLYDLVDIQNKKIEADTSYTTQDRRSDVPASVISISQPNKKSNSSGKKSSENSSGKDFALPIEYESNRKITTKPLEGEVVTPPLKDGKIAKIKAQVFSDKAYNKSDVNKALKNTRLAKVLSSQQMEDLANEVWIALNEAGTEEKRTKVVREAIYKIVNYSDEQLRNSNVLLENESTMQDLVVSLANEFKTLLDSGKQTYKGKLEDKYKKKTESLNEKYMKKTDKLLEKAENLQIRTTADYTTDKVFTQASVKRNFDNVEAVKKLSDDVRDKIARDLWIDLEMSNSDDIRDTFALKYSVKLYQAIRDSGSKEFENMSPADKDLLQSQLRYAVSQIVKSGRKSKLTKIETKAEIASELKAAIIQSLKRIDDRKKRRFIEASAYKGDVFKGSIDELTKIDWRGKFSANIARTEIKKLAQWYTEENPMLKGFETKDENSKKTVTTNFCYDIRGMLEILSEREGDFTNKELKMLSDVTEYFSKLVNEYDRVYIEGKWQDGEPLARELVDIVKKQDKVGVPIVVRALRNKLLSAGFRTFGDALSVMKLADMYGDGLFTRYYNEWLQGEINADAEAMKIKEKYDAFMKENPKFLKNAETETVKLHGIDVRKIDLISYAMTLKRKQAWESIAEGGVVFRDPKDGRGSHIYPTAEVVKGEGYSKRLEATMQAELDNVMSMLTEKDIEYMKVLEEGFELARTTKAMGDMQRYGFVSVIDGYYYPIKHEYTSHLSSFDVELIATDRYANASFNKSQTEGAKSAIRISSADATFNSHVKGVSRYLYLSPVMDSFNKLYKLQLNTGANGDIITSDARRNSYSLQSVIDQSKSAWRQDGKLVGFDYLQNLMLDTMGMGKNVGDDFAAKLRGAAVTFSLGANPKVLVTQLSSLISSTSILSYGSHFKALGIWNGNVDNYSVVAELRNSDYTVAKAEGVIDRINTWSRVFTAGISLMDRFVVYRAWAACQAEVAKNKGLAVGTEENRVAAGKLLDKVILETQQNSLTSRRTEGARRGNILTKQVQMYKSDSITSFGRAVDGWGEMNYLGALLKSNTLTDSERGTIQNRFEESKKKLAKAVGSIVGQAAFMMLVTEMFRNFYGKNDDETEEEKRTRLVVDAIGNLVNGVPVVSEVVSAITSNFGFETMEFSALNDFFDTAKGVIDYTEKKLEGKATERDGNKLVQNLIYTAGQLTGVPTRNMKNVSYGVVRLFSKDAAYKWDNAIYKKNYSADLNEAVAKGDMNRATMIMELALGEKLGGGFSTEAIGELTRLAGLGEKIIPSAISDTITVDGEEFVLSGEQYEAVKAEYNKVISAVNSFIESKFYKTLTNDQKAKALRKLYSTYKDVSYDRALGTQKNSKANLLSSLLGENVFNAYLTLGVIESDVDDNGNTISGSKREKIVKAIGALGVSVEERLLLICSSGYALKDGDIKGVSAEAAKKRLLKYILNLRGLSADEKAEIAVMCGFEVKNGKIINNFSKKSSKNLQKMSKVSPTRPKFVL